MPTATAKCPSCPVRDGLECPAVSTGHADYCRKAASGDPWWRARIVARAEGTLPANVAGPPPAPAYPAPAPFVAPPGVPVLSEWDWISEARLTADALSLLATLPDFDLVAAIPRSGLLPGSLMAYRRHVPLWAVSRQRGAVEVGHGGRLEDRRSGAIRRVLLVDDTVALGREMAACAPIAAEAWPGAEILRVAIYAHPEGLHAVDRLAAVYPGKHFLAWNWANAGHGEAMAFDFDGILCEDCRPEDDDDGPRYRAFLETAGPVDLPRRRPVHTIVTARHARYEAETRAWLARWGVAVEHLVMRDWPIDPGMPWHEQVGRWKAWHFRRGGLPLFAESCPLQAGVINRQTGKAVLCPPAGRVFPPRAPDPRGVGQILKGWLARLGVPPCAACQEHADRLDAEPPAVVRSRVDGHAAEVEARLARLVPLMPSLTRPLAGPAIRSAILRACDQAASEALRGAD